MAVADEVVLVVDDDLTQLLIAENHLNNLGVTQTIIATSAMVAIERLQEVPSITTVLLDIMMPDMDGAKCLRAMADIGSQVRIILVSGADIDIVRNVAEVGRELGLNVVGFLAKPVLQDLLKARLESRIGRTPPRSDERQSHALPSVGIHPLMDALSGAAIVPWYQPVLAVGSLTVVAVEALARWPQPDGSVLEAASFVPVIEEAGMSDMLFHYMLDQVLRDRHRWQALGHAMQLSINVSMDCAFKTDFAARLAERLNEAGVPPRQLILEFTQSRAITDSHIAEQSLRRLADLGVSLAMDDVGSRSMSLQQLAVLPFAELKLDGDLVRRAGAGIRGEAELRQALVLSDSLGVRAVAEGTEALAEYDRLAELGVERVQGSLLATPMAIDALLHWLDEWRAGSAGKPVCARPWNVLMADADRAFAADLHARLSDGCEALSIHSASSGEEALERLETMPLDMVLLDFHLPGLNGIGLLQVARALQPQAQFVMVSAAPHLAIAEEATRLGALYCPKPLSEAQIERIRRTICPPH